MSIIKSLKKLGLSILTVSAVLAVSVLFLSNDKPKDGNVSVSKISIPEVNVEFDILSLNDTHGYLETTDKASLSKIAAYMNSYGAEALRVSSGDMFQGTGISNLTHGRAMIEAMNAMKFDCMVVGNHEFDWGIETILSYFDGDESNGEANFPLLAANIVDKNGEPLKYAKPYMIKEINGARVGVIGIIGQDLETSISAKSLAGHVFTEARPLVEKYSNILRNELGCNMIIVATHAGSSENNYYSGLDVDFIINGHTHRTEAKIDAEIPFIQSGRYSNAVGHTVSLVDYKEVTIKSIENIMIQNLSEFSPEIDQIVADYKESLDEVLNAKICTVVNCSRDNISKYTTSFLKKNFKVDAAFVNGGCFRVNWDDNKSVTYSDLLEMIPFDNEMKICTMTGKDLKDLIKIMVVDKVDIVSNTNFKIVGDKYYMDNKLINDNKKYKLVVLDYVFDNSRYVSVFGKATDIQLTSAYIRDLLHENLLKAGSKAVNLSKY